MGQPLPVIVSFGGVNSAGRASQHHATARLVHDALPATIRERTLQSLPLAWPVPGDDEMETLAENERLLREQLGG